MSDIKKAFKCNPYIFLIDNLSDNFNNILVPGFTPSFRKSGLYHKRFSYPEYGEFSRIFFKEDCHNRTDDAIHSILIKGIYSFDKLNHHDSFSYDGCYSKLDDDNVLIMNIGTPILVSAQLHYIENVLRVPYVEKVKHAGIIYYNESYYEEIEQINFKRNISNGKAPWNRLKLMKEMLAEGILSYHNINGLLILFFRARDLRFFLEEKINKNPYYLII